MSGISESPIEPGLYRHFKGDEYTVMGILPNWSNGHEGLLMVEYVTALGERGVRNYSEFNGTVEHEGEVVRRFEKIEDGA
ncbi:DUF1653 domain-containing protein [Pedobacter sp.]|nr:DUF1653 domain-containing protein [Candidatus Saccharibacteria bacterium]